jgi:hypothetical protein
VKEETTFRDATVTRLDKIESTLKVLQLSSSANTPNNPASQTQAEAILAESKRTKALPASVAD